MRHLPTLELLLCWLGWLLQPQDNQPLPNKDVFFSTRGDFEYVLLWRCTEDIYDQSLPTESWPEGMKKTTSYITLCHCTVGEGAHVFSEQEPQVQLNHKPGREEILFYLYICLFLEQVKGQFCPYCSLSQYWGLRVSLDHTLFVLMTAVRWIILQSDILAPCPVPPLAVINWRLAYSSLLCWRHL